MAGGSLERTGSESSLQEQSSEQLLTARQPKRAKTGPHLLHKVRRILEGFTAAPKLQVSLKDKGTEKELKASLTSQTWASRRGRGSGKLGREQGKRGRVGGAGSHLKAVSQQRQILQPTGKICVSSVRNRVF